MKTVLFVTLAIFVAAYVGIWLESLRREWPAGSTTSLDGTRPSWAQLAIEFVTNFFDTLGIGNFAPTTAIFRFKRMVPDEGIPETMNVGHTLPVVTEAFIYITIVQSRTGAKRSVSKACPS